MVKYTENVIRLEMLRQIQKQIDLARLNGHTDIYNDLIHRAQAIKHGDY